MLLYWQEAAGPQQSITGSPLCAPIGWYALFHSPGFFLVARPHFAVSSDVGGFCCCCCHHQLYTLQHTGTHLYVSRAYTTKQNRACSSVAAAACVSRLGHLLRAPIGARGARHQQQQQQRVRHLARACLSVAVSPKTTTAPNCVCGIGELGCDVYQRWIPQCAYME